MGKQILASACVAILTAAPALAQGGPPGGAPGGGGPPAGVPGGGMGAGPPMTPPGLATGGGIGTSDYARDNIASQRGQFGRDFADQQRMTAAERQQMAEQFRALAEERRGHALRLAELARSGATFPPDSAKKIRSALAEEIDQWRAEFQVERREWQAMRDQWLAERGTMSPQEWALRRAAWFQARDAWVANQRQFAQSRRR